MEIYVHGSRVKEKQNSSPTLHPRGSTSVINPASLLHNRDPLPSASRRLGWATALSQISDHTLLKSSQNFFHVALVTSHFGDECTREAED